MVPVLVTWREETTAKPCTHTVLHDLLLGGQKPHSYKPQTPQPMSRCLPPGMSSIRIIQNLSLPCRHPPQLFSARDTKTTPAERGTASSGRVICTPGQLAFAFFATPVTAPGLPDLPPSSPAHSTGPGIAPHASAELVLPALQTPEHPSWDLGNKVCHSSWRFSLLKRRLGGGSLRPLSKQNSFSLSDIS